MARQATARVARTQPAEVVESVAIDTVVNENDQALVRSFLSGIVPFFRRASELERHAVEYQQHSKTLVMPTNGEEDGRLQQFIKTGNAARKTVEEHWGICQVVSRLHRALTGKRGIAVAALEEGAGRAQGLHNRYVDAERRRVQAEEDRLRREEEQRQRAEQERRAAELEERALAGEAAMAGLSEREERFVEMVWQGYNTPATAARSCGYKNPEQQGARLMETAKVKAAITAKQEAASARKQAAAIRQQPVSVEVERPKMDVQREGTDRTTWSGEVIDEMATIMAFRQGTHGIPPDLLQINPVKLNEYARSLNERLDLWPGVRAKKTTKTV